MLWFLKVRNSMNEGDGLCIVETVQVVEYS